MGAMGNKVVKNRSKGFAHVMSARIAFRPGTRRTCSCVDGPGDERSCMPLPLIYALSRCSPRTSAGATAQKRYSASRQFAELYRSPRLEEIVLSEKRCNIQSKVKETGQPRDGRLVERQLICSRALPNVAQGSPLVAGQIRSRRLHCRSAKAG
jgi:hypothetical protein